MNLSNCPECGRMYVKNSFGMCEPCRNSEETDFAAIKNYIEEINSSCTLVELTNATGVSIKKILGYIREGRLVATQGMIGEVTCTSCKAPISSGYFCEECTLRLNRDIRNLYKERVERVPEKVETKLTGIKMKIKDRLT